MTSMEIDFRDAKAKLNAVTQRLLNGDRTAVSEADEARAAVDSIRREMNRDPVEGVNDEQL